MEHLCVAGVRCSSVHPATTFWANVKSCWYPSPPVYLFVFVCNTKCCSKMCMYIPPNYSLITPVERGNMQVFTSEIHKSTNKVIRFTVSPWGAVLSRLCRLACLLVRCSLCTRLTCASAGCSKKTKKKRKYHTTRAHTLSLFRSHQKSTHKKCVLVYMLVFGGWGRLWMGWGVVGARARTFD